MSVTAAMIRKQFLGLTIALLSSVVLADRIELPDIGESSGQLISPEQERAYGQRMLQQMRQANIILDDPLVMDYVHHVCYRLVAFSDKPENDYTFFVVNSDRVNAFAAPGGFIGLHTQLILTAERESEVAAVIAHEIAHITQRHLTRAFEEAKKLSIPLALATIGAIVLGGGDADVIQTAVVGSQALSAQNQINFTRANEHEADRLGIQTLADAGFEPVSMADFFGRMSKATRIYGKGPPEFLRTHPVNSTRIAEAKNRAESLVVSEVRESPDFFDVRERIRALSARNLVDSVARYEAELRGIEISDARPRYYGLAVAALLAGRPDKAVAVAESLAAGDPDNLYYQLIYAESAVAAGRTEQGYEQFEQLRELFPGNRGISLAYAKALLNSGEEQKAKQAEKMLRPVVYDNREDTATLAIYAQVATAANEEVRAAEASAEQAHASGLNLEAVRQLENLSRKPGLTYYEHARIASRLAELRPLVTEAEQRRADREEERSRDGK